MRFRTFAILPALFLAFACGDETLSPSGAGGSGGSGGGAGGGGGPVSTASFKVRPSVEQIMVWKAKPGTTLELHDGSGNLVQTGKADAQGSLVFRKVAAGEDYMVSAPEMGPDETAGKLTVKTVKGSLPSQDFYAGQQIGKGYGYITTRDGTQLSVYVTLPGPIEKGPYPTILDYSGYSPSKPGEPIGEYKFRCDDIPVLCDAPNDPSALIAGVMGYATVSVNMRGTGCSGGAYDYFEDLQLLDGYDAIEAVAAQPWVLGHRIGMTGLSYPGIAQLFVARTHPPSLAAITPLSVIGNTYSTGRPGGIFNDGFALEWITNVLDKADPYGQGWEKDRVAAGDKVCEENQLLHSQKVDVVQKAKDTPYYADDVAGVVNPTAFAHEIEVPVFLASAFQDEQTGPFFFTLLDQMKNAKIRRFTVYNGVHVDGFAPQVLAEWKNFLDIYVAHKVPVTDKNVRDLAPIIFQNVFKSSLQIPPDRFANYATWEEAKAAFEAEQDLRVIFEDGGTNNVGAPVGTTDLHFAAWPPSPTKPLRLYFQPDGSMGESMPVAVGAASSFKLDPDAGHRGIMAPGGDVWDPLPAYDWRQPAAGYDVIMESAPIDQDLVMVGTASVDLWLRSPVDDADLEANLMEVRPDGQERFIQSGWLRASLRKLDKSATELWPEHTYREEDLAPLVPGEWVLARVGIAAFSHVLRKGSKIRVTVDTPGDSRASWQFGLKTFPSEVRYDIGHSAEHPSSLVLPVLDGVKVETPLPACPSLRAQQCRSYVPYVNTASAP